ncbi:hypothetical protein PSAC2689_220072 [Paraburkholderia sacchari]
MRLRSARQAPALAFSNLASSIARQRPANAAAHQASSETLNVTGGDPTKVLFIVSCCAAMLDLDVQRRTAPFPILGTELR